MVLSEVQATQTGQQITQHIQSAQGSYIAPEEIQTKGWVQKVQERDSSSLSS